LSVFGSGSAAVRGIAYLPGLEARRTPLLLNERHVSLKVVVHLEVGALLVDDCVQSLFAIQEVRLGCLTGGSGAHVCGCEVIELC